MTPVYPDPDEMIQIALEIFGQFAPLMGITLSLAIVPMLLSFIARAFGAPVTTSLNPRPGITDRPASYDDYETDDDPDDEIEDRDPGAPAVPVQCHRCLGVTEITGRVGRCYYCGGVLSAADGVILSGHEPMISGPHRQY